MTRYLLLVLVACGGARVTAPPATGDGDPASAVFGGTAWRMPGTVDHIAFAGDAMIVTSQGGAIARFTRDGKRTVLRDPSSVDIAATALVGTTLILAGESPFAFDTTRAIASPLAVERAFSAIAASNTLAVIPPEGDDPERPLEVVELATGKVLRTLEHSRGYTPTLVSGDRVLAGRHGRAVGIWSMASGKRHRVFGNGGTFALSPDGAHLAVGTFWSGEQALVDIYAVEDGTRTAVVDAACSVGELAFSPDGRRLAWACDDETRVVSVPAGKPVAALAGTGAHVRALAWSPDGAVLAAGGNDNVLHAWDARSWQPLTRVVGTRGEVSELVVAGRYLMSRALGDQSAWLWVTDTKKPAIELGGRGREVHAVATDGDALLIAVRSGDRMALERWSGARRTQASATPPGSFGGWPLVRQVGLLADGGAWYVSEGRFTVLDRELRVRWTSPRPPTSGDEPRIPVDGAGAATRDGATAVLHAAGELTVYDLTTGTERWRLSLPDCAASVPALSPSGQRAAIVDDRGIRILDLQAGRTADTLSYPTRKGGPRPSVVWHTESQVLALVNDMLVTWDLAAGRPAASPVPGARSLATSGDVVYLGRNDGTVTQHSLEALRADETMIPIRKAPGCVPGNGGLMSAFGSLAQPRRGRLDDAQPHDEPHPPEPDGGHEEEVQELP